MKPVRIQRKRTKGYRLPKNTVYVGRPTKAGNPHSRKDAQWFVEQFPGHFDGVNDALVFMFEWSWGYLTPEQQEEILAPLRGKNLACWCPLKDEDGLQFPCHADVLLDLANPHTRGSAA